MDPKARSGKNRQPIIAWFGKIPQPSIGQTIEVKLHVRPLISAPKMTARVILPNGVEIGDGVKKHLFQNVIKNHTYTTTLKIKVTQKQAKPIVAAVDIPFHPVANFHVQTTLKLSNRDVFDSMPGEETEIGGFRVRAVNLDKVDN